MRRDIRTERLRVFGLTQVEERRVGGALKVHFDVIPACAERHRELIRNVERRFTENTDLLVRPQNVIAENDASRKWTWIAEIAGCSIANRSGDSGVGERIVRGKPSLPVKANCKHRPWISKIVQFGQFEIRIKRAERRP